MSATSMIKKGGLHVDDRLWTPAHEKLLKRAASYAEVERILVNPGIKKKLCETVTGDRGWLRKVRPFWGHDYHFHVRIGCQPGSSGCKAQAETTPGDGCDNSLDWWFTKAAKLPDNNADTPKARDMMTMRALPRECVAVLNAPAPESEAVVTLGADGKLHRAPASRWRPSMRLPRPAAPTTRCRSTPLRRCRNPACRSARLRPDTATSEPIPAAAAARDRRSARRATASGRSPRNGPSEISSLIRRRRCRMTYATR